MEIINRQLITVRELIEKLKQFDPNISVGCSVKGSQGSYDIFDLVLRTPSDYRSNVDIILE